MAQVKIHGGDLPAGDYQFTTGTLFRSLLDEIIPISKVANVEAVTQENVKKFAGTVAWGAVGALALGPLGLLAGVLAGGRKTEVTFLFSLNDGRKALATTDSATYSAIMGELVTNQQQPKRTQVSDYLDAITPKDDIDDTDDSDPLSFLR